MFKIENSNILVAVKNFKFLQLHYHPLNQRQNEHGLIKNSNYVYYK